MNAIDLIPGVIQRINMGIGNLVARFRSGCFPIYKKQVTGKH